MTVPGTVELRVHGASGMSPESVLTSPVVVQVAGDDVGRFFRPAAGNGAPLPATDGHQLEGYHWGLFTSGSWRQGLWFLLLPFGLVNLAAHALPVTTARIAPAAALAALRLLGLTLSATFALGLVQLVDLVAVQGIGGARPAPVAAGLLVLAAVLAAVAVLGRGRVAAAPPGGRTPAPDDPPRTLLAEPAFYRGDSDVPLLRRLHGTAGAAVGGVPAGALLGAGWLPLALLAVAATGATVLGDPRQPAGRAGARPVRGALLWALPVLTTGATAVLWVLALAAGVPRAPLPGLGALIGGLVVAGAAALLVVLVATARAAAAGHRTAERPFRPLARGLTAWVVASLGAGLGVGFTAGLVWATAWATGGAVPALYRAVAAAWGLATVLLVVAVLLSVAGRRHSLQRLHQRLAAAYGRPPDDRVVRRAAAGVWRAGLRRGAPAALVGLAVLTAASAVVVVAGLAGLRLPVPAVLARPMVALGTVALVAFALALLVAGRGAVLHPAVRRGVNVLWDVVSFWPREVHPVVPPPYSQRAVSDVAGRVVWLLTTGGADRVVLAGHSQGSLLCVAALLHVPAGLRSRVALVTHGSQLRLAWARAFPAAVSVGLLRWVLRSLDGRWRNLTRETDPFGGDVLSWDRSPEDAGRPWTSTRLTGTGTERGTDEVGGWGVRRCGPEWRLLDPAVVDPQLRPWPGLRGHADAADDPAWPAALADVSRCPPTG